VATYQEQIQSYVGPYSDTVALSQFLTVAAKRVVDLLSDDDMRQLSSVITIPPTGADISNTRVFSATGDGYPAREVPQDMTSQISDSGSLYFAVTKDPVFYKQNQKVFVLPSSANNKLIGIPYPVVSFSDTDILGGIQQYDEFLVLYSAIQCRIRQIEDARAALPVAPIPPDLAGDIASMQAALNNDQDVELANGYVADIQTRLAEYTQALQRYSIDIQKAVHQITFYQSSLNTMEQQYEMALQLKFNVGVKHNAAQ
jgi:hypothetical protein